MLIINDIHSQVNGTKILKGVNLNIKAGEIHTIMGTNGAGKSTLASLIMGHPNHEIINGELLFEGNNLIDMPVDKRARSGIFLAMQYPSEIEGVSNVDFLRSAMNARRTKEKQISLLDYYKLYKDKSKAMNIPDEYSKRYVNEGYSGGEKKRNEIFQMLMLKPKLIILDEIDSGLDIDAIKIVGENISKYFNENKQNVAILIITHYPRILDYVKPNYVHVMHQGKIIKTGDYKLAQKLEESGYDWLITKQGAIC